MLPESVELEGTPRTAVKCSSGSRPGQRDRGRFRQPLAHRLTSSGMPARRHWSMTPAGPTSPATWRPAGYRTHHADLHLGGEDFAVYLQHIPGAFVSIGSASEYGLHHPAFNPDERLIAPAHYFAQLAEQHYNIFNG